MLRELAIQLFFAKTQRLAQKYSQKLGLMLGPLWTNTGPRTSKPSGVKGSTGNLLSFSTTVSLSCRVSGPSLTSWFILTCQVAYLCCLDLKKAALPDIHDPLTGQSPSHLVGHQARSRANCPCWGTHSLNSFAVVSQAEIQVRVCQPSSDVNNIRHSGILWIFTWVTYNYRKIKIICKEKPKMVTTINILKYPFPSYLYAHPFYKHYIYYAYYFKFLFVSLINHLHKHHSMSYLEIYWYWIIEYSLILWIYYNLFNQFPILGYLDYTQVFYILKIVEGIVFI